MLRMMFRTWTPMLAALLGLCFLVRAEPARSCEWDGSTARDQGLSPASVEAGARLLDLSEEVRDAEGCRAACCRDPACDLALVGFPMDGGPQCSLVSCVSRGRDVCALQRSSQFQVFRRKARGGAAHIEPRGAAEPRNNATDKVLCLLPVKVGSCRAAFSRFFYNVTAGSCSGFIYGGCEANGNNFDSQEECEAACSGVTGSVLPEDSAPAPAQPAAKAPRMAPEGPSESDPSDSAPAHRTEMSAGEFAERCEAAPKTGPCEALLTRWFYNQKTGSCQSFIYGGCRGNKNNYQSEDSCKAACTGSVLPEDSAPAPAQPAAKADPSESDPSDSAPAHRTEMSAGEFAERCEAAPKTGPCEALLTRWFYNQKTGSCQSFIYGGCRGNKNNYQSEDSCKAACTGSVLPEDSAPAPAQPAAKADPSESDPSDSAPAHRTEMSAGEFAERCEAAPKTGPCEALLTRWFYNQKTGSCQSFIYGGCRGNKNNYQSEDSCKAACTGSVLPEDSAPAPAQPAAKADPSESDPSDSAPAHRTEMSAGEFAERCEAAPKTGPCEALLTRWFYNQKTGSCQSFIYGGCRGNKNNYQSEDSCKAACTGSVLPEDSAPAPAQPAAKALRMAPEGPSESDPSESDPSDSAPAQRTEMSAGEFAERCEAATETGPCRAALPRWFYNQKTGSCQSFIYGGCRGNKNNYQSEDSCKATCTGVKVLPSSKKVSAEGEGPASTAHCRLSPDCGPCRAAFTKFYYESDSASCQPFLFGGCRGNANRFDSKEECMRSCGGDGTFDGRGVSRSRWTAAFFLFATLAVISVLLLAALVFTTLRRHRLSRRTSSVSDKEELLPEPDELSSLDSLTLPEEPKPEPKA